MHKHSHIHIAIRMHKFVFAEFWSMYIHMELNNTWDPKTFSKEINHIYIMQDKQKISLYAICAGITNSLHKVA